VYHEPIDFDRLAIRHKEAVYRQMVRLCGNYDDAEDALVEALMSAFQSSSSLRDEPAFQAWLAAIARRACLKIKHKEALAPLVALSHPESISEIEADPSGPREPELVERQWVHDCIQNALDRLPPIYREVYVLHEIEGHEARFVAEALNLTLPATKSRILRARALARRQFDAALCLG
jgi:RNA polymerase sigma-70 factor (ECF subfamily)